MISYHCNELLKLLDMKVKLKTAFSILDGRLSTSIDDVYKMLSYVFDDNLFTHQLPDAMDKLRELNPEWFENGVNIINDIKKTNDTNDFKELMDLIDSGFPNYEIELKQIIK